jgi:transglutaminase-like putative cysteine protease
MIAVTRWFSHRFARGVILQVALLYFALWCTAFGLSNVVHSLDLPLFTWTITAGILIAWLVARSNVKSGYATVLIAVSGFIFILLFQGKTGGPSAIFTLKLAQFITSVIHRLLVRESLPIDPVLLSLAASDLQAHTMSLIAHFSAWLASLAAGRIAADTLVNSILWGTLLWAVSSWAAWHIRRRGQVLIAFLPASALLAGVLDFSRPGPYILVPVIFSVFTLMITLEQQKRERRWEREKIDYTTEIRVDIAFTAIPLMLAILGLASIAPAISLGKVVDLTRHLFQKQSAQADKVGQSLGLMPEAGNRYFSRGHTESTLPQVHLLGSGPELSEKIVMEVHLSGSPAQSSLKENYYWRSLTYDVYTGAGWTSSNTRVIDYKAGDQPIRSSIPAHRLIHQEIHLIQLPGGPLYHSGELVSADQDYRIAWRLPLETGPDAFGASISLGNYTANSLIPVVSQEELRLAGTDYPEWVKERYLQLPPNIPKRVSNLAQELIQNLPSPYDKAVAIQSFLRTYTYTLDLAAPPTDRDIADYFLFDLRKGYCDYYATAMVVLSRSVGIPARFVTGYASGKFDSDLNKYIVTEADAHSWVEVYFPDYGWIEFEPTAGQPALLLPERLPPPEKSSPVRYLPVIGWFLQFTPDISTGVILLAIILILVVVGWQTRRAWMLRTLNPVQAAVDLYRRFRRSTRQLDDRRSPGETPYELSRSVARKMNDLQKGKIISAILKPVVPDADHIVQYYTMAEFSQHPVLPEEKILAIRSWQRLSWRLRFAILWGKIWRKSG